MRRMQLPPQKPLVITDIPGPKSRALVAAEAPYLAPGTQSIATLSGIAVARGEGCLIEDVDGNRYLDIAAGICVNALGHAHPRYREILKAQIDEVTVGSLTTARRAEALKRVASHTPPGLDKIQLYSGGTEAVEAAMRLAKSYTKKFEFLSFWGGFHGKTAGTLSLIGDGTKNHLGPMMPGAHHAPYAYCYRCPLALTYPSCGLECAEFARKVIKHETTGELAAILIEPIQGTAGNIVPPPEFMPAVKSIAKENGALLVSDEMICGFGRTGQVVRLRALGRRARRDHDGQGAGRRLPGLGARLHGRDHPGEAVGGAVRLELLLRRQPDGRARRSSPRSASSRRSGSSRMRRRSAPSCCGASTSCRRSTSSSATCAARAC